MSRLKITRVKARRIGFSRAPTTLNANLVSPTSHFPDHATHGRAWWGPAVLTLVEIHTDEGLVGYGTAGGFTGAAQPIIDDHLAPLMVGADPFALELNWSKLYHASVRFGRRGVAIAALSGIDIACWDIVGKALGVPVYELLGGRTKPSIPVYVSRLYALHDLDELAEEARAWQRAGFTMMKQRFGFGPADGVAGMRANEALVCTVREAVGDDVQLAADAYMGWDLPYAKTMERRLRPYNLSWIEEPLLPHHLSGYAELRRCSQTPIAHGEHEYTRYGFAEIIDHGAADLLQPDVNRVGGLTEARKICAMAAARDLPVIPHSNEAHNLHLVMAQVNCPFAEYFPDVQPDTGNELFWRLFQGNPVAAHGQLTPPDGPGLGLSVNPGTLAELELHTAIPNGAHQ